ncbi:4Fe-4S dicluster domain-containing protein [Pseudodesulfovibrio cashew]|uniref:Ferredoxin n=1 Tax=Pseudodesulfovibrio cashew TaxID=2678688 RepID=A0A6I6JHU8_9BACT|nr:mercury methylation ferredoxin HgcB [Pseudodesulfovibrio cashew]QGY41761.1 4Fe-4S dicluster domain-containing protein [Pseudodesulfovibrio cashew]
MKDFRYIDGVSTLTLDRDTCVGCGLCTEVCPQRVLRVREGKAEIIDFDACMECGACVTNCPVSALSVHPGVGCASHILSVWLSRLTGRKVTSCC